ncbi:MAG: DUF3575 domain-containing protein [Bacteroidota bacterium]
MSPERPIFVPLLNHITPVMKSRILVLTLALLACFTYRAEAQIDATINPLALLFGGVNVGADFVLADNLSVEGNLGFTSRTNELGSVEQKYTGIPVTVTGKYYFNPDDGADRFYASVFLRFVNRSFSAEDIDASQEAFYNYDQTRFGAGLGVGFKTVSRNNIVFDFGLGVGRAFVSNFRFSDGVEEEDAFISGDLLDIMLTAKIGIGYRFGG